MARPKQFKEQDVLNKAVDLFWAKGYNATSIQDLVTHLGINRASLYDTFGGKQNLFHSALKHYREQSLLRISTLIQSDKKAMEKAAELLEMAVEESVDDPQRKGCFVVNATVELAPHISEISDCAFQNLTEFVDTWADIFEKAQQAGEIPAEKNPRGLAAFLFNTFNGLRVIAKTHPDRSFMEDIIKTSLYALAH